MRKGENSRKIGPHSRALEGGGKALGKSYNDNDHDDSNDGNNNNNNNTMTIITMKTKITIIIIIVVRWEGKLLHSRKEK